MKISAIIPAYNSQDFILDAIKSIQNQTKPVAEIIIIDDGSTDNTQAIVEKHTTSIKYFKQENQGPSAARNSGIMQAKGDWVAFLDADDQWTADKIDNQLKVLEHSPELHLIAGDMQEIGINNEIITDSVLSKHNLLIKFKHINSLPINNALAELVRKNFIPTGTVLVKRQTVIECGLFNPLFRFAEDLELWAKIAAKYPITCMPEILMLRRLHGDNATNSTAPMLTNLVEVMRSIRAHTKETLSKQNISADHLVANALADLGYWHFTKFEYQQAKSVFFDSLKEQSNIRSLVYFLACFLPHGLINWIRNNKVSIQNK